MRIALFILAILHGLIHLLGFVKAFGFAEVKAMTAHVSKPIGMLWAAAAALLLVYGTLHMTNYKFAWLAGLVAAVVSQVLIFMFWSEAKFGTIPNVVILVASTASFGLYSFNKTVQKETHQILKNSVSIETIITENAVKALPLPVQEWLRKSGAIGKPLMSVGKVTQRAEMKMSPDQKEWMPAAAVQYTRIDEPAFIWTVDVKMNDFIGFRGRDKFEHGKGEMLIRMNSLINVVDERGEKLNEGTLQRYLGEMVWFPSLALSPYVTWDQISDTAARATMSYRGTQGSGTFFFNAEGDFTKFSAMRYRGNEADSKREEWIMSVTDYKTFEGIKVPAIMNATWKLDNGDWTWLNLEVTDIRYDKNIGD